MSEDRPMEMKRARRGLSARSWESVTTRAKPRGRRSGAPGGSRNTQAAGPPRRARGRAHSPRAAQARRRSTRNNPDV